ncbi:hypothetical protein RvY_05245 [Ramazzottius varieornatus]|uniref:Uncharacterized protein n=1 Tax=Ramazzottius varieornatus TaxID=947166 RepID=A0A1D1UXH6_RAMVA|nr:hypothetical protein RvY_05245 [Ramazzottius varieornatus]
MAPPSPPPLPPSSDPGKLPNSPPAPPPAPSVSKTESANRTETKSADGKQRTALLDSIRGFKKDRLSATELPYGVLDGVWRHFAALVEYLG